MGKPNNPKNKDINVSDMGLILQGLNHLDQGVSLFDADLKLRLYNDRFESILNYPKGFVHTGMSFEELIRYNIEQGEYGSNDGPEQQLKERLNQVKNIRQHQFKRERPDGTVIKITGSPLPDGGFISTYEDITLSENAKRKIEEREEQFRTYLEVSPVGALLIETDGSIRYHNSRILDIFGYSEEELKHITTSDFYYNKKDRKKFINTLISTDAPANFRFLGKKKDGRPFPLLLTSQLITLKGVKRIFTWVNDLTNIVEAEKTIERLNEHNELILSAAGAGIFGVDANDVIQFINPAAAKILGYSSNELKEKHLNKLLVKDIPLRNLSQKSTVKGETEMVQKSGRTFPIKYTLSKMDINQNISGKVIVFDDISERVAAEDVLRQAMEDIEASSKAKSHFLSTMSHELRTPLNAILGFAQILNNNQSQNLNNEQLNFIHHIFKAGEHLLKLINEAIDIAAIESGQVSLSKQSIDIDDIADACITHSKDMASLKNITLENCQPRDEKNIVIADHGRLQQVMMHLISNAIKYNNENGTVQIICEPASNNFIRIIVRDTGKGIPNDEKEDVFTPFNRLKAHSDGIEGTGLGLTLCKHLTQLMGGNIDFSTSLGKGSSFWIELPKANENSPILFNDKI